MTLVLVRHAWAGDRGAWPSDDRLRPLDERGRKQAARLPEVLHEVEIRRIVSSPYLRCLQTVEPLAAERGLEVELAPELGEEHQKTDAPPLLRRLVVEDVVACVHGGIESALGIDGRLSKGGVWLFAADLGRPQPLATRQQRRVVRAGARQRLR